jgi:hypothetical protein
MISLANLIGQTVPTWASMGSFVARRPEYTPIGLVASTMIAVDPSSMRADQA